MTFHDFINQPIVIFYASLLTFAFFVWLISLLGLVENTLLDFESGADFDNGNVDSAFDFYGIFFDYVFQWLGIGMVPLSIIITLFSFLSGFLGISMLYYFLVISKFQIGTLFFALFIPITLVISGFLIRLISKPLNLLFKDYRTEFHETSLIGTVGIVQSQIVNSDFGFIMVEIENGNKLNVDARTQDGIEIEFGKKVLITNIYKTTDNSIYLVKKLEDL